MRLLLALALLCWSVGAAVSPANADTILDLYRLSGARDVLREYPKAFEGHLTAQGDVPPRLLNALRTALRETADTTRLDSLFLFDLREGMNETTAKAALTFLKSPTGRKVTDAERRAGSVEAVAEMNAFFQKMGRTRPDPERVDLLQTLDVKTGATETLANCTLAIRHTMAVALDATRPEKERQGADALWAFVRQSEARVRFETQQQVLAGFLFAYRNITKAELRAYVAFASSGPGQEYHRVLANALMETLTGLNRGIAAACAHELLEE